MADDLTRNALVALSEWIDAGNAHRDPEAVTWGRLAKITEEAGEVIAAFIGATGQNPRKGVTHSVADVGDELLDVAITALGAYEHLTQHQGIALDRLAEKIAAVAQRAGVSTVADDLDPVTAEPLDLDALLAELLADMRVAVVADHPDDLFAVSRDDVLALLAGVDRLRAALTTARRDALTEAADALDAMQTRDAGLPADVRRDPALWLHTRAAQEED